MSVVVPIKTPEEPAAEPSHADGWALLDGMRRKLDDQGVQNRKTAAQVTQLAESIAALVEVQRRRTRRLNLNSFVAYLIFTLLCGAGAYAMYWSRSHELVTSLDRANSDRDAAVRRADDATKALAAREAADAKAALEAKTAAAATVQVAGGEVALKNAIAAFKAGRFAEVGAPLEAALATEPFGPRAATMHYYLGVVAAKAGELDKAIAQLQGAIAANVTEDDAHFQLASALDRKGDFAKARGEYDRYAAAHPQSPLAAYAMRRSWALSRIAQPPLPVPAPVAVPKATPVVPPTPTLPTPAPTSTPTSTPMPD